MNRITGVGMVRDSSLMQLTNGVTRFIPFPTKKVVTSHAAPKAPVKK
jgi:hypothetical protein